MMAIGPEDMDQKIVKKVITKNHNVRDRTTSSRISEGNVAIIDTVSISTG